MSKQHANVPDEIHVVYLCCLSLERPLCTVRDPRLQEMNTKRDVGGDQGRRKREENLRARDDDRTAEDHELVKNPQSQRQ